MPTIHSTAVIDPTAEIAEGVDVGPFCFVGPNVKVGAGTRMVSHVTLVRDTTLGEGNTLWPQVTIGADPQDLKYKGEPVFVTVGDHNDIREGVTIHRGTGADRSLTSVGNHNLLMAYVHIAHDCEIGSRVIIANGVQLAGHINIEDHANLGGAAAVHHFVTIGRYAYIGGMTRITADVPPFMFAEGNPARIRAINSVGLKRRGYSTEEIGRIKDTWRRLFKVTYDRTGVGRTKAAMLELERDYPDDPRVAEIIAFIRRTEAGVYGRWREGARRDNR